MKVKDKVLVRNLSEYQALLNDGHDHEQAIQNLENYVHPIHLAILVEHLESGEKQLEEN